MVVASFTPAEGVKIQTKENEPPPDEDSFQDQERCKVILSRLPTPSSLAGYRLVPVIFEKVLRAVSPGYPKRTHLLAHPKDDDTNFHIDLITAASNLRATNYSIETASAHVTKGIAGKIIPGRP